jgi:hypothetical protein
VGRQSTWPFDSCLTTLTYYKDVCTSVNVHVRFTWDDKKKAANPKNYSGITLAKPWKCSTIQTMWFLTTTT